MPKPTVRSCRCLYRFECLSLLRCEGPGAPSMPRNPRAASVHCRQFPGDPDIRALSSGMRYSRGMYRPPAFREDRPGVLRAAIRAHPLATLVTYGRKGLQANLLPLILATNEEGRDTLQGHLAKANGQLDDLRAGTELIVIFQGPQAYITPSWYVTKREHGKVVPTWNYVTVQVWGKARVIDDPAWLFAHVRQLTRQQEELRNEPWAVADAPASFIASQLKGIVGLEIPIDRIEGKWKASQNQPAANRERVADGLREQDPASLMAELVSPLQS